MPICVSCESLFKVPSNSSWNRQYCDICRSSNSHYWRKSKISSIPIQVDKAEIPEDADYETLKETFLLTTKVFQKTNMTPSEITVRIDAPRPIGVVFTSDWQIGGGGVDYEKLFIDIETIRDHPGLYTMWGGDSMDLFLKQSHLAAAKTLSIGPSLQYKLTQRIAEEIAPNTICLCWVNHDDWVYGATGLDFMRELAQQNKLVYIGQGAIINLFVGSQQYRIFRRHKARFNSAYNKTHPAKQMWTFGPADADILITEDKHVPAMEPFTRHGQRKWAFVCGTYKVKDRFADEHGFYGMEALNPTAVLFPNTKEVIGFIDMYQAIEYLRLYYE